MSTETTEKTKMSKDKKYYMHSIIGVALMFLFGFLPPIDPITPLGMKSLGVFVGLIYLWTTVEVGWPILAAFVAIVALDLMPITTIFTNGFANQTFMICMFSMMVVMPLGNTGIFDYVTAWLLRQKFFYGHPWRLTVGLISLVYFAGIFHAPFIGLFIVYELIFKICDVSDMKYTHPWVGAVVVGATVAFVFGPAFYPFAGLPMFTYGMLRALQPFQVPFFQYMVFAVACFFTVLIIYVVLMKLLRVDISALKGLDPSVFAKTLPPMSSQQKKISIFLFADILAVVLAGSASTLPDIFIIRLLSKIGIVGICWIFMCILLIWRMHDKSLFSMNEMAQKTQWEPLLIIAIGMSYGPVMAGEGTGIKEMIYQLTSPILADLSPAAFALVICLITLALTNLFNNTVVYMVMVNVIGVYLPTINVNLLILGGMMLIASQMAFLLPGSSSYAAFSHGQSARMGRKNAIMWGFIIGVASALALPLMYMLGTILF